MATKENFIAATERLGIKVNGQRLTRKDEFAGQPGSHGEGKPSGSPGNFLFATGIECSYPTIQHGAVRRDELRECGHYEHYQRDFELVADLGLKYLRYGLPYYAINPAPGVYDWAQADELMEALKGSGVTPILDLLHFGVPDHLGNFQNPELPAQFAAYAGEVARRYPWVRFFTPVNEVFVTARSSARDGLWNEQLSSETAFITAIKHGVAASCLACQAIVQERPDAVFIQSESAEHLHDACAAERDDLRLHNKMNVAALDLLYAHPPDAEVYQHLRAHGMSEAEYQWFMSCEPPGHHIIGNDYYGRNERIILPDRSEIQGQEVLGWGEFARRFYQRYRKPVMHTETNTFEAEQKPRLAVAAVDDGAESADGRRASGRLYLVLADRPDRLGQRSGRAEWTGERGGPVRFAAESPPGRGRLPLAARTIWADAVAAARRHVRPQRPTRAD